MRPVPQRTRGIAALPSARRARVDDGNGRRRGTTGPAALSGSAPRVTGAILAGGDARRFGGTKKGLLPLAGSRIIDRVAGALAPVVDEILIVANDADAADWVPGTRVVRDLLPGRASMVGIHAALAAATGSVLVVAWDMPFLSPALLATLAAHSRNERFAARAVVPRVAGRAEPCCALYAPEVAAVLEGLIRARRYSMTRALETIEGVEYVDEDVLRAHGDPDVMFRNINDEAELRAAESWLAGAPELRSQPS